MIQIGWSYVKKGKTGKILVYENKIFKTKPVSLYLPDWELVSIYI